MLRPSSLGIETVHSRQQSACLCMCMCANVFISLTLPSVSAKVITLTMSSNTALGTVEKSFLMGRDSGYKSVQRVFYFISAAKLPVVKKKATIYC